MRRGNGESFGGRRRRKPAAGHPHVRLQLCPCRTLANGKQHYHVYKHINFILRESNPVIEYDITFLYIESTISVTKWKVNLNRLYYYFARSGIQCPILPQEDAM